MKILNGITGKLAANAEMIGVGAGLLAGTTSGLTDVMSIIDEVLNGNIHMPNWEQLIPIAKPFLKQAAITYLAGAVLKEVDIGGTGKFGTILKKGAVGYGATSFLLHVLYYSTHASEGSNPVKGAQSFMNQAPAASNYEYYGK